jgi:hypothetical protein
MGYESIPSIKKDLIRIISEYAQIPVDLIHEDTTLEDGLWFNRNQKADLLTKIEGNYFPMHTDRPRRFETVGDVVDYFLEVA